ncbi:MAG: hypothetical protein ACI3XM_10115, partial [Eubacteriales bacterium]
SPLVIYVYWDCGHRHRCTGMPIGTGAHPFFKGFASLIGLRSIVLLFAIFVNRKIQNPSKK